jgi:hypothetical protein
VKSLLLYRKSTAKFQNCLPLRIGDHHLLAVFSNNEYVFRWNDKLQFWKVTCEGKNFTTSKVDRLTETSSLHKIAPYWNLAVYCKSVDFEYVDACLTSNIGEQKLMRCPLHNQFLVKQPISCQLACCISRCSKKSRWRCLAGGSYCEHGVCFGHGKRFIEDGVVVDVCYDIDQLMDMDDFVSGQSGCIPTLGESDMIIDDDLETHNDNESIFLPIGQETAYDCDDLPANHSRKDMIPIYDVNNSISGHYLWNQGYGVLTRQNNLASKVQSNAMLQHIVAVSNNASVSLLYPEGQLFPRIF